MNQLERHEQFDLDRIRQRVSDTSGASDPGKAKPARALNPYAASIARQFSRESHKPVIVTGMIRLAEGALVTAACLILHATITSSREIGMVWLIALAVFSGLASTLAIQIADGYLYPTLRSARSGAPKAVVGFSFGLILFTLFVVYPGGNPIPLLAPVCTTLLLGAAAVTLERAAIAFSIRKWARNGFMERRAVIVGGGAPARDLIRELESQTDNDIRICGIFDDRDERRSPDMVAGYRKLGSFDELVEFARTARIDIMIIALPLSAENRILELLRKLWVLPVDIRIAAHSSKLRFRPRAYSNVGQVSMLDVFDRPITDWDSVAKRVFDIVFSLLAIAILWPVMLAAALAVKFTSKGPILFVQKRHGFNNEEIKVYKFRSMYTEKSDPSARQAVTKNDPRVTPVGRFIRKTSIDELPQFFNVLQGSLSLVGPRPHAVMAQTADRVYADIVETYFARHRVKPGVTGWAQINGWRGEIDSDEKIKGRIESDLYYIENWSLWLDFKILFLTPIRLLNTENAY